MALIVEDGTGKTDAQSFVSVTDANTYASARGDTGWTGAADADKEKALIKATDFLCRYYIWVGTKKTQAQALVWPRSGAEDWDGYSIAVTVVPSAVKDACVELAMRARTKDLLPDLARGGRVSSVRAGSVFVAFNRDAPVNKVYQTVDMLLRGLIAPSSPELRVDLSKVEPAEVEPAFTLGAMDTAGDADDEAFP